MADQPVFKAAISVATRANKIKADMFDIPFGNLNPTAMNARTALPPFEALDAKSINGGPMGELITGSRRLHMTGFDESQIDLYLSETVNDAAYLTYQKGRDLKIGVYDQTKVTGTREMIVSGTDSETYAVHREIEEPTKFEKSGWKGEGTGFAIDLKGALVEAFGAKASAKGLTVEVDGIAGVNGMIEEKTKALSGKIAAFEGKIGAGCLKAIATYDAMPHPSIIAPVD